MSISESRQKAIRDRAFSDGNDVEMALIIAHNPGALVSAIKVDGDTAFAAKCALDYHVGSRMVERGKRAGTDAPMKEATP